MCARLQGCDLIGITEMWWDGFYDWSVGMEGYRLFRKDRQGRQGESVVLYVNDKLECMEYHPGMDEELTESLWVRIKGWTGTGDTIVGLCYKPLSQEDQADEDLYRQLHICKPWSSWGTSASKISVGGTTQQGTSSPGGSWNALMRTSFSK
ncbi:hypothetical protein GRJ2_000731500 [Grus japonensis]|uniref:Uncharacterized protein n=1 Tax=Grus japonensis TaxID=30415 RepID=A0ABC9WEJ8_GRUJA